MVMADVVAISGTDILLLVNTGTEDAPVYEEVGGQRGATYGETTDEIDASSKDSEAFRVLAGRKKSIITLDALYIPDDACYVILRAAMRAREFILVRRSENGADVEEAQAIITNLSRNAPDNEVASLTVGLTIDGDWEEVGS